LGREVGTGVLWGGGLGREVGTGAVCRGGLGRGKVRVGGLWRGEVRVRGGEVGVRWLRRRGGRRRGCVGRVGVGGEPRESVGYRA